eukprot:113092-Pelagomonas_calceolata.AAC.1
MLSDIVPTVFLGPGTKNPKCVSCKPQKPQGQRMKTSLYQSSHMKNPGHCAPGLQLIKQAAPSNIPPSATDIQRETTTPNSCWIIIGPAGWQGEPPCRPLGPHRLSGRAQRRAHWPWPALCPNCALLPPGVSVCMCACVLKMRQRGHIEACLMDSCPSLVPSIYLCKLQNGFGCNAWTSRKVSAVVKDGDSRDPMCDECPMSSTSTQETR